MKSWKRNGMETYLRRVRRTMGGTRAQRQACLERVRASLSEIPHADTMSYDILVAAAGKPETFAADCPARDKNRHVICAAILFAALAAAAAVSTAALHDKSDGFVETYRLGQALPEGEEVLLREKIPNFDRIWG